MDFDILTKAAGVATETGGIAVWLPSGSANKADRHKSRTRNSKKKCDRRTDTVAYRVACTRLKRGKKERKKERKTG